MTLQRTPEGSSTKKQYEDTTRLMISTHAASWYTVDISKSREERVTRAAGFGISSPTLRNILSPSPLF